MTAPTPPAAPGAPAGGQGDGGQAPTGTQQPQQNPAGQPAAQQQTGKTDLATLPQDVREYIEKLRTESATHRTGKTAAEQQAQAAQQQRDAILKAAGLKADGTEADPDPAALTEQIQQAQAVAWTNAVELSVVRSALAVGADSEKLIDSRAFIDSLDEFVDLDPNTAEFKKKLADHVKAYVDKHPTFKAAAPGPARSGGDHPGGAGQPPAERGKGGIAGAIGRHYGRTG
jgi:hypothetical protein